MSRRIASLWFPRLASERVLRGRPCEGPFALTLRQSNTERLYCLNGPAEVEGLHRGQGLSDARALCPQLRTSWANPGAEGKFLYMLARWARHYCPWVNTDARDGLLLDITGSAHLFGGEEAMMARLRFGLNRAGLSTRVGLADTRGAAWATARFDEGIAAPGTSWARLTGLPTAALRLSGQTCTALERMGIATIGKLAEMPRVTITRRFGAEPLLRLDQASGQQPEQISPLPEPASFSARLTLPEPIGLIDDLMAGLARLLRQICVRLEAAQKGARILLLTVRRVDQASTQVELRLARAMRDAERLAKLFERHVQDVDAGFGIDQLRLEAVQVEALPLTQINQHTSHGNDRLADLVTRLGNRVGLDRIIRFLPADCHIPERSSTTAPAAYSEPAGPWSVTKERPLRLFPPEPIIASGSSTPVRFRWRAMSLRTARATGPERIAPEWWLDDPAWRSGTRDYWKVETHEGRRLWLFFTPQNPGWFVQGEFA